MFWLKKTLKKNFQTNLVVINKIVLCDKDSKKAHLQTKYIHVNIVVNGSDHELQGNFHKKCTINL